MESPAVRPRLYSVDALRGLAVIGMIVVNAAAGLSARHPVPQGLLHVPWAGFHLPDLMFPAFITIVGMSVALAPPPTARAIWGRAGRLFLIGLLLGNMHWLADWSAIPRIPGVLQRIAIVYALTAFIYPRTQARTRALLAAALLIGYWLLLLVPPPDGSGWDLWQPGMNFSSWLDRALLAPYIYVKGPLGFDPEGLLGTFPALAQALLGTLAAERLLRPGAMRALALWGLAMIAAGLLWAPVLPVVKALWTGSFVLLSTGLTLLIAALLHASVDRLPGKQLAIAFGRNAMAAYVLHNLLWPLLSWDSVTFPMRFLAPTFGTLVSIGIFLAVVAWPILAMNCLRIYLRV